MNHDENLLGEEEIFGIAIGLAPAQVHDFLQVHCSSRPDLRRRIEQLLRGHREANLLDRPLASLVADAGSIVEAFKRECQHGKWPNIDEWLLQVPIDQRAKLREELLTVEIIHRRPIGEIPSPAEYGERFPEPESNGPTRLFEPEGSRPPPLVETADRTKDLDFQPRSARVTDFVEEDGVGSVLAGKYKLVEAIGEGGMGSVFLAQQTTPVRRLVAVKIIKAGMDSKAVLARFDAERQALAMMDHPNIAKVLDAGTTERRRPFFVMELVKGVPITQFCDQRQESVRGRIELFIQVCQAIQHAHQKGVIHRDIKPSNVLVAMYDEVPVPKVIDFGLAKATGEQLTEATLVTGLGTVVGTPEYMSPEQASFNQLDIDTRTDVYSLGVLLYELLTGTTPVDRKMLKKAALLEILRIVREVDAPLASSRLSSSAALPAIAAQRGTDARRLSQLLRGDLDWIASKSLEKDRNRRYETANDLGQDLARYLVNDVVEARPPSNRYRLQKLFLRNKGRFLAAAGILLVLIIGVMGTGIGLLRAMAAEGKTRQEQIKTLDALKVANLEKGKADAAAKLEKTAADKERLAAKRELAASKRAQAGEREATRQAVRANTTAYAAQLSTVRALLSQGDLPGAYRILQECPWEPRHWEYDWLAGEVMKRVRLLSGHRNRIRTIAFTHDGKSLLSGAEDGSARVWDVATGDERLVYRGHEGLGPFAISVLPDDKKVLSIGWTGTSGEMSLWSLTDGATSVLQKGLSNSAIHFGWTQSADGKRIAVIQGARPHIWDTATGAKIESPLAKLSFDAIAMNADGSVIAGCEIGANGVVGAWKVDSGEELFRFPKPSKVISYSRLLLNSAKNQLLCVNDRGTVDVLDSLSGNPLAQIPGSGPVQLSSDGQKAARKRGDQLVVYDTETWRERFAVDDAKLFLFSPDSEELFTVDEQGFFGYRAYLVSNARRIRSVALDIRSAQSAAMSSGKDWLALGTFDHDVWLISLKEEKPIPPLVGPSSNSGRPAGTAQDMDIDPEGRLIATIEKGSNETIPHKVHLWDVEAQQDRVVFEAPVGVEITCVAFSSDGRLLNAAGAEIAAYPLPTRDYGGEVKQRQAITLTWELETGKLARQCQQRFPEPPKPPDPASPWDLKLAEKLQFTAMFVAADTANSTLWTLDEEQCLAEWDIKSGTRKQLRKKVAGVSGRIERAAFSKNGLFFAMRMMPFNSPPGGVLEPIIGIWDSRTGKRLLSVPPSESVRIGALAISDDGKQLAITDSDAHENPSAGSTVHLWSIDNPATAVHCSGHRQPVAKLSFSPDGKRLITASKDGTTRLWDCVTGQESFALETWVYPTGVALTHSGRVLTSSPEAVRKWDARTGILPRTYLGHRNSPAPGVLSVAWNPHGEQIVSVAATEIRSWDSVTGQDRFVIPMPLGEVRGALFSPKGNQFATTGAKLGIWNAATLERQLRSDIHFQPVTSISFSPLGDFFVSAGGLVQMVRWNLRTTEPDWLFGNGPLELKTPYSLNWSLLNKAHADDKIVVAISPNGKLLASASDRQFEKVPPQLKVWDLETGKELACIATGDIVFLGWGGQVFTLAWSPDGKQIIAGNGDGVIRLHDSETLAVVGELTGHLGQVTSLALDPKALRFASAGADKIIRVWSLPDRRLLKKLSGHRAAVRSLSFAPDGQNLASASDDGTVKIWNLPQ